MPDQITDTAAVVDDDSAGKGGHGAGTSGNRSGDKRRGRYFCRIRPPKRQRLRLPLGKPAAALRQTCGINRRFKCSTCRTRLQLQPIQQNMLALPDVSLLCLDTRHPDLALGHAALY